jgi:hypothetical protein
MMEDLNRWFSGIEKVDDAASGRAASYHIPDTNKAVATQHPTPSPNFIALAEKTWTCRDADIAFKAIGFDPSKTGRQGKQTPIYPWPDGSDYPFHGAEAKAFIEALMGVYKARGTKGREKRAFRPLAENICKHLGYNADEACIGRLTRRFKTLCS